MIKRNLGKESTCWYIKRDTSKKLIELVILFKQKYYFVANYIFSLHTSSSLRERVDFRTTTLKWRYQLLKSSRKIKIALFQNKRNYEAITVSSQVTPTISPDPPPRCYRSLKNKWTAMIRTFRTWYCMGFSYCLQYVYGTRRNWKQSPINLFEDML